jgi:hypothetical protein
MPKITGRERAKRISTASLGRRWSQRVGQALFAGGELIRAEAAHLITEGAVSGKNHVPRCPASLRTKTPAPCAPHRDGAGRAAAVEVSSNAPYAVALEAGTSKMGRAALHGPGDARKRKEVVQLVQRAVNRSCEGIITMAGVAQRSSSTSRPSRPAPPTSALRNSRRCSRSPRVHAGHGRCRPGQRPLQRRADARASASEDLDVAGVLADALGATIAAAEVVAIAIVADAATPTTSRSRAPRERRPAFLAAGDGVAIGPGDIFLLTNRKGIGVTPATGDLIHVANSGAGTASPTTSSSSAARSRRNAGRQPPRWITVRTPFDYPWPGRQAITHFPSLASIW